MTQRCKHIQKDGFHTCGSYAFNLWSEGIEQGSLCDVHYWQQKAQRPWAGLTEKKVSRLWSDAHNDTSDRMAFQVFAAYIEAELKELNT